MAFLKLLDAYLSTPSAFLDIFSSLHSLLDDTEMCIDVHIYRISYYIGKIYMCACIRVLCLLFLSEQPMYECMNVCYVHEDMLARIVIYIDVCYLLYNVVSPISILHRA